MRNIYDWLPFGVDEQTSQRSRKWLSHNGKYFYGNSNKLLNAHKFIPHTSKAIALNASNASYVNTPQLERWYIRQVSEGAGRNNTLIKYGLILVDAGLNQVQILNKVVSLNSEFTSPLPELEIHSTIIVTINKKLNSKDKE
jgi:hypothetical protein